LLIFAQEILLRFGAEEDAISAQVVEYGRGGLAIVKTLQDTWVQRLEHEHKIVLASLDSESSSLATFRKSMSRMEKGAAWRDAIFEQDLVGKLAKHGKALAKEATKVTGRSEA
jgi:hypothetical protein